MQTFKKIQVEQNVLATITCNKCGKEQEIASEGLGMLTAHEFQHFKFNFGYGSKHDEEIWEFDLCTDCLDEFTESFSIPKSVK